MHMIFSRILNDCIHPIRLNHSDDHSMMIRKTEMNLVINLKKVLILLIQIDFKTIDKKSLRFEKHPISWNVCEFRST